MASIYPSKRQALIGSAAVAWFPGSIFITTSVHPIAGGFTLAISAGVLMAALLLGKQDRVTKGWYLVGLAVVTTWMYGFVIEPKIVVLAPRRGDWVSLCEMMIKTIVECLNLACAGAGGSIIAAEGERRCVELPVHDQDHHVVKVPQQSVDINPFVSSVHQKLDDQVELIKALDTALLAMSSEQRSLKRSVMLCAGSVGGLVVLALVFFAFR